MSQVKHILLAKTFDSKGRQISQSYNMREKSHPVQAYYAEKVGLPKKVFLHSEISAILRAKDKKIHKITVERYGRKGDMLLAKPCDICSLAIKEAGIIFVEYTTPDGWTLEYII